MKAALPKRTAKTPSCDRRCCAARWRKFNAVGGVGIGVQLAVLLYLKNRFHLGNLWATALAVEAASYITSCGMNGLLGRTGCTGLGANPGGAF
jgi:hypothetical protein